MESGLPVGLENDQSWISNDEVGSWTPVRRERRSTARNDMVESQGGASKASGPVHRDLAVNGRLGGVIFGYTSNTYMECVAKSLFCMSHFHWAYVKHIEQGMPIFLFNYFDRMMLGVFEAVSNGELNFSSESLIQEGTNCRGYSKYPAQVHVRLRPGFSRIIAMPETVYQQIIADNYWSTKHFQFELDKDQTRNLVGVFESRAGFQAKSSVPKTVATQVYSVVNRDHLILGRDANIDEKSKLVGEVLQSHELKVREESYRSTNQISTPGERSGSLITQHHGSIKHEPSIGDVYLQNFLDTLLDEHFYGAKYVTEGVFKMIDEDPDNLQDRAAL